MFSPMESLEIDTNAEKTPLFYSISIFIYIAHNAPKQAFTSDLHPPRSKAMLDTEECTRP